MLSPIKSSVRERFFDKLSHRMGFTGSDDIIVWLLLLEHEPHCKHILLGISPITLGVEIAEVELVGQPRSDLSYATADLSGDKSFSPTRGFMVEKDTIAAKDAVAFPVINSHPIG